MNVKSILLTALLAMALIACTKKENQVENLEPETPEIETLTANLVHQIQADLGEGAFWNHKTGEFFWIDIEQQQLHIFNPEENTNQSYSMPKKIGTVVPYSGDESIVALSDGAYLFNKKTKEVTEFALPDLTGKNVRLNDGKCDPMGRLWVGSMHNEYVDPVGNLYMISEDGSIKEQLDSIIISNGIVWSHAADKMYYIDTPKQSVFQFDYDNETGDISNQSILAKIDPEIGGPDGMAIDQNGDLWVCLWNGNHVIQIDHQSGEILKKIEVPAHNITSCAFGGPNLETLYITTASIDMTNEEQEKYPLAGSLFSVKPGVKGVPTAHFGKQ